jgi:hypothetical protein
MNRLIILICSFFLITIAIFASPPKMVVDTVSEKHQKGRPLGYLRYVEKILSNWFARGKRANHFF